MRGIIPCVVNKYRRRVAIANAHNGMAIQVDHHRAAGIDFRFIHRIGKSPTVVIGFLVITIGYHIAFGFIKEFSAICAILISNAVTIHVSAGELGW